MRPLLAACGSFDVTAGDLRFGGDSAARFRRHATIRTYPAPSPVLFTVQCLDNAPNVAPIPSCNQRFTVAAADFTATVELVL